MYDIEWFALEVSAEEFEWKDRKQYTYVSSNEEGIPWSDEVISYSDQMRYPFDGEVVQEIQWYLAE